MGQARSRRMWLCAAAAVTAATAVTVPATFGHAAAPIPSLKVITGVRHIDAQRYGTTYDLYIPESVYLASTNGAFEIDASRQKGGLNLEQVRRTGSSVTDLRHIATPTHAGFKNGLPAFFSVVVTNAAGAVVASAHPSFCPVASYDAQRVAPNSVDVPTYPQSCGDRLTKKMVWGIDAGWAEPEYVDLQASPDAVPDGTYTLTVAVAPPYVHEFRIPVADAKASLSMSVTTISDGGGCTDLCPVHPEGRGRQVTSGRPVPQSRLGSYPPPVSSGSGGSGGSGGYAQSSDGLPDLAALPAHGLQITHHDKSGKDYLGFGATIWNKGPGTFDVEGFRHDGRPTMQARQYLYRNGHSTQSMPIGRFEFDNRVGHHHWHLEDVARYDLLDANQNRVLLSDKQSFCLAPTDPIDMTVPDASWNPAYIGLQSACPTDQSLWLRETLPVGWGDTYVQEKGGQSFNITALPNGRYIIRIATNPFGRIHEVTRDNDTALLAIDLGGTPGARTVTAVGPVKPN